MVPSIALLAAALGLAADKDTPKFEVQPAGAYTAHQTNDKVTVGAKVYETAEEARAPFGKLNPNQYGLLPVLVVIENGTGKTLRLEKMKVEYVAPDRTRIESTPAADAPYLKGPDRPRVVTGPIPTGAPRVSRRKNPFKDGQLEVREFAAKMLPPGQQSSGFVYFQTGHRRGSQLYVTGLVEAGTGKEIFYFEVPLD